MRSVLLYPALQVQYPVIELQVPTSQLAEQLKAQSIPYVPMLHAKKKSSHVIWIEFILNL